MLPMYASVCTFVFGMQKFDCVRYVFVELCAPCNLCLVHVHAHGLNLAACFSLHLLPLKQPCTGCLDVFRDLFGSENMLIMPSHVSHIKPSASLLCIYAAQKSTSFLLLSERSGSFCCEVLQGYSIIDISTFLCTCKHTVIVHEPVIFNEVNYSATFSTMLGVSAYCNERIRYVT